MSKVKINSARTTYDDILFRSVLEMKVYKALKDAGYDPEYEPEKIVLMEKFKAEKPWYCEGKKQETVDGKSLTVRAKTYLPDFKIKIDDKIIYIEAKGFPNERYPLERKMFLRWAQDQKEEIIFSEIRSIRGLNKFIEELKKLQNNG